MIQINCIHTICPHDNNNKEGKVIIMKKRQKVPKTLFNNAVKAAENLFRFEPIERYVIERVIQASKEDVTVDDVFIKLARKILNNHPAKVHNK